MPRLLSGKSYLKIKTSFVIKPDSLSLLFLFFTKFLLVFFFNIFRFLLIFFLYLLLFLCMQVSRTKHPLNVDLYSLCTMQHTAIKECRRDNLNLSQEFESNTFKCQHTHTHMYMFLYVVAKKEHGRAKEDN